jgi:hypothetical protein
MSEKLFWAVAVVVVVATLYGYWLMSLKDFIFALAMYASLFVPVLFSYVFGSSGGEPQEGERNVMQQRKQPCVLPN